MFDTVLTTALTPLIDTNEFTCLNNNRPFVTQWPDPGYKMTQETKITQPLNGTFQIPYWDNNKPFVITKWPEPGYCSMQGTDVTKSTKLKSKRQRTAFTTDNLRVLEEVFSIKKYIDRVHRVELAKSLNVNEKVIKVWFQNRRMKQKKENAATTEDSSTISPTYLNVEHFPKQTKNTEYSSTGNNVSNYKSLHECYCMINETGINYNQEVFFPNTNETNSVKYENVLNQQYDQQLNVQNYVNPKIGSNEYTFQMFHYLTDEHKTEKSYTNQIDELTNNEAVGKGVHYFEKYASESIQVNSNDENCSKHEQTVKKNYYELNSNNVQMYNHNENNKPQLMGLF